MSAQARVGFLFIGSIALVVGFAWILGLVQPFSNTYNLKVMYNYAGGLEKGSPVRVMGIKVGKVRSINFRPDYKSPSGEQVKLEVEIDIDKSAWPSIRRDSKFFINLAGVIGEKFLEISPGSTEEEVFQKGDIVRGEDPPRVDQLISQSYGLAGKVIEMLEKNEGSVSNTIQQLDRLVTNVNRTLVLLEKTTKNKDAERLVGNLIKISDDMAHLTGQLRSKKAEDSFVLLNKLLFRLEDLDGPAIRKFLQEEGVKAKIF